MDLKGFLKNNSSNILTGAGVIGVIGTAFLAAHATPKAIKLLENTEYEKGEKLTNLEKVRVAGPAYIPAVLTGVGTIACVVGANILNRRQQATLMSAYALLDRSYKDYRNKVRELYGEEANVKVLEEMAKDQFEEGSFEMEENNQMVLFYDMRSGQYFNSAITKTELDDGLECYIIAIQ